MKGHGGKLYKTSSLGGIVNEDQGGRGDDV